MTAANAMAVSVLVWYACSVLFTWQPSVSRTLTLLAACYASVICAVIHLVSHLAWHP
jgi:hypothetical protein